MKRLLTGYAMHYNRRHNRQGHLFQNRYKSILCQADTYLLELVRYIHLNPLRAKLVAGIKDLGRYPFSGHGVILGQVDAPWQATDTVLGQFGKHKPTARERYQAYLQKGIGQSRRPELTGGGLVRSAGGWAAVKEMRRNQTPQKGDERILGDGDFVQRVLSEAQENLDTRYRLKATGMDLETLAQKVAELVGIAPAMLFTRSKKPLLVQARSLFCYWATSGLGVTQAELSQRLGISPPAVSLSVNRGRELAREKRFADVNFLSGGSPS